MHVIDTMRRGGRERQLAMITKYSRLDNYIVCFQASNSSYLDQYNIGDKTFIMDGPKIYQRATGSLSVCRKINPDCIISWGRDETLVSFLVSHLMGVPMINMSIRHGIRKNTISQIIRMILLHLSRNVVANSHAGLAANYIKRRGMVLYNGVESNPDTLSVNRDSLKRDIGISSHDDIVLVSVANLVPYKDYETVLKSLAMLISFGILFTYIIIGDGPNRNTIEQMVAMYELCDCVVFTGRVSNVSDYLMISDILIHSSMGEGCSNAILEAMKHGLPVVATNVGGTPEIVSKEWGILFEYQDASALTKALQGLIQNPDLRRQMGAKAQQVVRERFSVEAMISRYEEIIQDIVSKHSKRRRSTGGDR